MTGQQLPLGFSSRPAYTELDFVRGAANHDAWQWIERWPDWPYRALVLHGPAGAGKTHLAHVWAVRAGAAFIQGKGLDIASAPAGPIALDDGASCNEEALFHLINRQRERGDGLLITLPQAPAQMAFRLPDLASRLSAMALAGLAAPDDALLSAVLMKQFADRQLLASEDVINYLVMRMTRSFEAARDLVAQLDEAALAEKRNLTVPFARETLAQKAER